MLLALISIVTYSLAAKGQGIVSKAICSSDYGWANNSQGESPCLVAANVDALCNNNGA